MYIRWMKTSDNKLEAKWIVSKRSTNESIYQLLENSLPNQVCDITDKTYLVLVESLIGKGLK